MIKMQPKFLSKICLKLATLGPIGYLKASGTMGTLAALPAIYFFLQHSLHEQFIFVAGLLLISLVIVQKALLCFKQVQDPSEIIVDEVVGTFVTFVGLAWSIQNLIMGFVLFRLFDIYKPFGIAKVEKLPGALGVIFDDLLAGLFANLGIRLLLNYFFM
ncbi:MAG: phosphatidylglycerophosphatase A family protein [Candidatus Chromulinivorax sp.]